MINDGNMDHSLDANRFLLSEAGFVEDSYQQFLQWCAQSTNCAVHGQNVEAVFAQLLRKAQAGVLVDPSDGTLVDEWLLLDATQFRFSRPRWVELGQLLSSLNSGDAGAGQPIRRTSRAGAANTPAGLVADVRPHFCQDWAVPYQTFDELSRAYKLSLDAAPRMRASVTALSAVTQCFGWPGLVNNPQHKLHVTHTPTILMMNGIHDPQTGYSWALNAKAQLGGAASLLTYLGSGHVVYRRTSCTQAAGDRYLMDLAVPATGATCPADDSTLTGADDLGTTSNDLARGWN